MPCIHEILQLSDLSPVREPARGEIWGSTPVWPAVLRKGFTATQVDEAYFRALVKPEISEEMLEPLPPQPAFPPTPAYGFNPGPPDTPSLSPASSISSMQDSPALYAQSMYSPMEPSMDDSLSAYSLYLSLDGACSTFTAMDPLSLLDPFLPEPFITAESPAQGFVALSDISPCFDGAVLHNGDSSDEESGLSDADADGLSDGEEDDDMSLTAISDVAPLVTLATDVQQPAESMASIGQTSKDTAPSSARQLASPIMRRICNAPKIKALEIEEDYVEVPRGKMLHEEISLECKAAQRARQLNAAIGKTSPIETRKRGRLDDEDDDDYSSLTEYDPSDSEADDSDHEGDINMSDDEDDFKPAPLPRSRSNPKCRVFKRPRLDSATASASSRPSSRASSSGSSSSHASSSRASSTRPSPSRLPRKSAPAPRGQTGTFVCTLAKCTKCPADARKRFTRRSDLLRHTRAGDLPCASCDMTFSRKDALDRHLRNGICTGEDGTTGQ